MSTDRERLQTELAKIETAMTTQESLRGIMPEAQLNAALTPLLQKKAELQRQLSGAAASANVSGGGAVAQGLGATAVGERAVNVGGNVTGSINTGDNHTTIIYGVPSPGSTAALPPELAPLRQQMVQSFNLSELQTLAFDLGITYDDLPHGTRSELAESLIGYCHRNGRLPALLALCRNQRPHIDWPRIA